MRYQLFFDIVPEKRCHECSKTLSRIELIAYYTNVVFEPLPFDKYGTGIYHATFRIKMVNSSNVKTYIIPLCRIGNASISEY